MKMLSFGLTILVLFIVAKEATSWPQIFPNCIDGKLSTQPICNIYADYPVRIDNLYSIIGPDNAMALMSDPSPGIPDYGIPKYEWNTQSYYSLTGPSIQYAPPGQNFSYATVFPVPLLMSSTYDDNHFSQVAFTMADQVRTFSNFNRSSITSFGAKLNGLRDPRWGLSALTVGESMTRISEYGKRMAINYNDDHYWLKVAPGCDAFIAADIQNWNGVNTSNLNANLSTLDADWWVTPFESCLRSERYQGRARLVRCSANLVNGVPVCARINEIRDDSGGADSFSFQGVVIAECGAIEAMWKTHGWAQNIKIAVLKAIEGGVDIDCGGSYEQILPTLYQAGTINQTLIQAMFAHQQTVFLDLGYWDPLYAQSYLEYGWDVITKPSNDALSLSIALKGLVLLKNRFNTLPFDEYTAKFAIIGPHSNSTTELLGPMHGADPPNMMSIAAAFASQGVTVIQSDGCSISGNSTAGFEDAIQAAKDADYVIFVGGLDSSIESEMMDRTVLTWPGVQENLITQLKSLGKPFAIVIISGGPIDVTNQELDDSVGGIFWAGYPGSMGATAIAQTILGKNNPSGKLSNIWYPQNYVNEVAMDFMFMRRSVNSPGRTMNWYVGPLVYKFGHGKHYLNFGWSWLNNGALGPMRTNATSIRMNGTIPVFQISELAQLAQLQNTTDLDEEYVPFQFDSTVTNNGNQVSDMVALAFQTTENVSVADGSQVPVETLVAYERLYDIEPSDTSKFTFQIPLQHLAMVDANGDRWLCPGVYHIHINVEKDLNFTFSLEGDRYLIRHISRIAKAILLPPQ